MKFPTCWHLLFATGQKYFASTFFNIEDKVRKREYRFFLRNPSFFLLFEQPEDVIVFDTQTDCFISFARNTENNEILRVT